MEDELPFWNAHGENVVGYPLIEQVVLAAVVLVGNELVSVAILVVVENPLCEFTQQVWCIGVNTFASPEVVGFGKDAETIETMFGCTGGITFCKAKFCHSFQIRNFTALVELFVFFVAHFA